MKTQNYRLTKYACYFSSITMSAVANLSALLFVPFHEIYGISYTALGFLVLINFCTQLLIDLVFTFFSHKFNLVKIIKSIPVVVFIGFLVYTFVPMAFPQYTYAALVSGTLIFSMGSGLSEVLTSPIVAAIPSENPESEMSKLHSAYAWGVVAVVVISTALLKIVGNHNWMLLSLFWCILPVITFSLFAKADIPDLQLHKHSNGKKEKNDRFGIMLCALCIFFGGAAECTMTQWVSGFAEKALGISKVYGDIFGMALFAFALGFGRSLYAKKGKRIYSVLLWGMVLSCFCYAVAAVSSSSIIGLVVCVLTGFFSSMLWPGTIIYTNEKFTSCGVGVFALLAAGGDLGASLSPQLLGMVADKASQSNWGIEAALSSGASPDSIGMKAGMLVAAVFPALGSVLLLYMKGYFKKHNTH